MSFTHHQRVTPVAKHVSKFSAPTENQWVATPIRSEVRLRVKQNTSARGHVDGGWWPRSRQPEVEFPGLVLAMSSWVGPVRRVDYHVDDWNPTSHELTVEDWLVGLTGLSTLQRNTVVVAGTRQMSLLVVPPETPGDLARAVLISTAGPDAVGTAEELLAHHGLHLPRPS